MAETEFARELDDIDRKLLPFRARLAVVWRSIEHSRHGVIKLDPETYTQRKIEFGNLQGAIRNLEADLFVSRGCYFGERTTQWLRTLQRPAHVSLKQVWQLWHDVRVTRQAVADLAADTPTRERIDTEVARNRAEATYDCALRVFEGREPWDREKHLHDGARLRAPKRPEPTPLQRMQWKQKQRRTGGPKARRTFAEPYRKVSS